MYTEDIPTAHRWFAIDCNNIAWDLATQPKRNADEDLQMFNAAHASAYHWSQVGEPLNYARADTLLSHVHALLSQGRNALFFGKRALNYCQNNPCDELDLATAYSEVAFAHFVLKQPSEHLDFYEEACKSGKNISDYVDREIFFSEFSNIPAPEKL